MSNLLKIFILSLILVKLGSTNKNLIGQNCFYFIKKQVSDIKIIDNYIKLNEKDPSEFIELTILNMKYFEHLNLSCISNSMIALVKIQLQFDKSQILNNDFSLQHINKSILFNSFLCLEFINLKGFDLNFQIKIDDDVNFATSIYYSNLKTYSTCEQNSNIKGIFTNVVNMKLGFTVKYYLDTCPFIFMNNNIQNLIFYGLIDTFLNRNILSFLNTNQTSDLNSNIQSLELNLFNYKLKKSMLVSSIFKKIEQLTLKGSISSMDEDIFKNLYNLRYIGLKVYNLPSFLSKSLISFNYLNNTVVELNVLDEYFFDDEDFCVFKDLPIGKNVYFMLSNLKQFSIDCNCTLIWLFKNNFVNGSLIFDQDFFLEYVIILKSFFNNCEGMIDCHFDLMVEKCINKTIYKSKSKNQFINIFYESEIIDLVSSMLFPIICLIGISTNLINLIVIKYKNLKLKQNEKEKNSIFFKLIFMNSLINFSYCFFYMFHLVNKCISFNLCSKINKNITSQIFEIYIIEFFLNILKIWSNITIILISISRFIFINGDRIKISKFKIKLLTFLLLTISVLLNIDKIATIKINTRLNILSQYDYETFPDKNTFLLDYINYKKSKEDLDYFGKSSIIFYILFIVNFIINDFISLLSILMFDLLILYQLKKNKKNKSKMTHRSSSKFEKKEANVKKVILINCLVLFIFRSIHFALSLFIFFTKLKSKADEQNLCFNLSKICNNYEDAGETLYLISISYNLLIFNRLNNNFRANFNSIFKIK